MPIFKNSSKFSKIYWGTKEIGNIYFGADLVYSACKTVGWDYVGDWSSWSSTVASATGTCEDCSHRENTGIDVETRDVCDTVDWESSGSWSSYTFESDPVSGTCSTCINVDNTGYSSNSRTEWRSRPRTCNTTTWVDDSCATTSWGSWGSWSGYVHSSSTSSQTCTCAGIGNKAYQNQSRTEYRSRSSTCQTATWVNSSCATSSWGGWGSWSGYNYSSSISSESCTCAGIGNKAYQNQSRLEYRSRSRTCLANNTTTCVWGSWSAWSNVSSCTASSPSCTNGATQRQCQTISSCSWNCGGWSYNTSCVAFTPACSGTNIKIECQTQNNCSCNSWSAWTNVSSCSNGFTNGCQTRKCQWAGACSWVAEGTTYEAASDISTSPSCSHNTVKTECFFFMVWTCQDYRGAQQRQRSTRTCSGASGLHQRNCTANPSSQTQTRTRTCSCTTSCTSAFWGGYGAWSGYGTTDPGTGSSLCSTCSHVGNVNRQVQTRTRWRRSERTCNVATWTQVCNTTSWTSWTGWGSWGTSNPGTGTTTCNCSSLGNVKRQVETRTRWRRSESTCNVATWTQVCSSATWSSYGSWTTWGTTNPGIGSTTCNCSNLGVENREVETRTMWQRLSRNCIIFSWATEYRTRDRVCIKTG